MEIALKGKVYMDSNILSILQRNHEDWRDLLRKIDALQSTVREIQHALEQEHVSEHIVHTYMTIDDAITRIVQFATHNTISSAYQAYMEKMEPSTPSASHE